MDLDIAIKAIEYVINWRKEKSNLFNIWFYGGESLLRFDLIKKIVIYCNSIKKTNNIDFIYDITPSC